MRRQDKDFALLQAGAPAADEECRTAEDRQGIDEMRRVPVRAGLDAAGRTGLCFWRSRSSSTLLAGTTSSEVLGFCNRCRRSSA